MSRIVPHLVIDARPRGPRGPLAGEVVLGQSVLAHLVELALPLSDEPVVIHARLEEHGSLQDLIAEQATARLVFATGPPMEGATVLRTDRLYDPVRLRRALRRGRDPEIAVLWRLDRPQGLIGAEEELDRRRTYQPLGRFWALAPARGLARALCPTSVRPNAVTLSSASLVLAASAIVAWSGFSPLARLATACALALALVLDTADGHLARLQGTASDFGRWLDTSLDELGDMALHAATAWAAFARDGHPGWLVLGMLYGMGKYCFVIGNQVQNQSESSPHLPVVADSRRGQMLTACVRLVGHADVRWHLWIVLAAFGRLDAALAVYAVYFPARALAGAARKAVRHA